MIQENFIDSSSYTTLSASINISEIRMRKYDKPKDHLVPFDWYPSFKLELHSPALENDMRHYQKLGGSPAFHQTDAKK